MKKKIFLVVWGLAACGVFLNAQTLDEAILRAAMKISADLPADAPVAVIYFRSGSQALSDYVINELHGAVLRNHRVTPVKPDEMQFQNIRDELHFNAAGEIDGESARSIGRLLKVQYLITGSMERAGSILFTAVDAERAELQSQYSSPVNSNDARITSLLGGASLPSPAGLLEILTVTAGTVEVTGDGVSQTAEVAAGSSLSVQELNAGSYRVVMRYHNGKTEKKTVKMKPSRGARLKFNYRPPERLNSLGGSLGVAAPAPVFVAALQGTLAPWKGSFFDLGMDIGLGSTSADIEYVSLYPYARYAIFAPFVKGGGWYAGAGAGCVIATVTFPAEGAVTGANVAADISTGFIFRNGITLSYTLRTDFASANSKFAVGYSYRFKEKKEKGREE